MKNNQYKNPNSKKFMNHIKNNKYKKYKKLLFRYNIL